MNTRTFTAVLHKEEDLYVAKCVVLTHRQLGIGTLQGILRQVQVTPEEFMENL